MLIYETLAGSRLYGYYRENSDYDYRGVFLAPKSQLLGLIGGQTTLEDMNDGHDRVYYELRKFCDLALKGNPNILEILFSRQGVKQSIEYWKPFYENRYEFLSQQLRNPYQGFLTSEIKKLEKAYEPKAAANAWRLGQQAMQLLRDGDFDPTLARHLQDSMRVIREDVDVNHDEVLEYIRFLRGAVETIYTKLPQKPNREYISKLCVDAYERYYQS